LGGEYKVRYRNSRFSNEKIELDDKSFFHCDFTDCLIALERGETEVTGCTFTNCKLMLKGNAYTVGKIIKFFTRDSPLKVLDMKEPLSERVRRPFQKSGSGSTHKSTAENKKRR
jgi:ribosomal protein L37AE/L43A